LDLRISDSRKKLKKTRSDAWTSLVPLHRTVDKPFGAQAGCMEANVYGEGLCPQDSWNNWSPPSRQRSPGVTIWRCALEEVR
jgi:hypothetical protein